MGMGGGACCQLASVGSGSRMPAVMRFGVAFGLSRNVFVAALGPRPPTICPDLFKALA